MFLKQCFSSTDFVRRLARYGIYIAFVILVVVMAVSSPVFLTAGNIINILRQVSVNGIIACGMTFVILSGGIDLSPGSVLALAAVFASNYAHPGEHGLAVPIFAGLAAGTFCGAVSGTLIAYGRIAPFIVTLGMMTIARGFALVYTSGRPVINLSDAYRQIGGGYTAGVPTQVVILVVVVLLSFFVLKFTKFGRHLYAVGGNEQAARFSGIKTERIKLSVYAFSGLLAGGAGIVLSSRVMSGSPSMGEAYELDAIAAVVIGGTSLAGGIGGVMGTVLGVLVIGVMNNGLDLLHVSAYYQQVVKGLIIIFAALLDRKNIFHQ